MQYIYLLPNSYRSLRETSLTTLGRDVFIGPEQLNALSVATLLVCTLTCSLSLDIYKTPS